MNKRQFEEISKWQNETFGQATPLSKIYHLQEEIKELIDDLKVNAENRRLEFADCFMLLFGAAASDGMSYEKILEAIEEKMLINYQRKWGRPDENGVVHHVKPVCETGHVWNTSLHEINHRRDYCVKCGINRY